jgi:hypothetical protein
MLTYCYMHILVCIFPLGFFSHSHAFPFLYPCVPPYATYTIYHIYVSIVTKYLFKQARCLLYFV